MALVSYELRLIHLHELRDLLKIDAQAFLGHLDEHDVTFFQDRIELDRCQAVFEEGTLVAGSAAYSFEMTMPGLAIMPVAGVSRIGVMPTHRRRGLLSAMMRRQLEDIRARGEALSILYSSDYPIYRRFGYGPATGHATVEIDTRDAALAQFSRPEGRLRMMEGDAAMTALPAVYDRVRGVQPGFLSRPAGWWREQFADPERWRGGMSGRFDVTYTDPNGVTQGYVTYRAQDRWEHGVAKGRLVVRDLITVTREALVALWQYLARMDLVSTIELVDLPLHHPIRWMLRDPRRLRLVQATDALWLRLVDIPAALSARTYTGSGVLIVEVADGFCPDAAGTYRLECAEGAAICTRTDAAPDLSLDVADLGSSYLGNTRFRTLAAAGRVQEHRPGSLLQADALFLSDPIAWCAPSF
jgi:predicted acetyltransferase